MTVTNHERWGKLVKTWSTGKNYLEDDNEYPIPQTVEEFKEQLAKAQVFMTVPERFTQIKFVASGTWRRSWCDCRRSSMIEDSEATAQPARRHLSDSAVLQAPVQRHRSGDPGR